MNTIPLKNIDITSTPVGGVAYAWSDQGLHRLAFVGDAPLREAQTFLNLSPQPLSLQGDQAIKDAVFHYFKGDPKALSEIPLVLEGSEFQMLVWRTACEIPFGQTRYYGDISARLNRFNGARAVGMALNKNPIPLFVPCHRIISKTGALSGYVGGLQRKRKLIAHESKSDVAEQTALPWF